MAIEIDNTLIPILDKTLGEFDNVSVINDDFLNKETSLNINYNVNITGDNENTKKDLTVNGNINCNTLEVFNNASILEIENIYTKNKSSRLIFLMH